MRYLLRFASILLSVLVLSGCARPKASPDTQLPGLTALYLEEHLAWRPTLGTTLGLHKHDGRITDYSRASLESELRRLRQFDAMLASVNAGNLTREMQFELRLLQAMIRSEIFGFEGTRAYTRNPMTYAQAFDLTQYIKRDFAPLTHRVRSIIAIERNLPLLFSAARMNLEKTLPKTLVETAIDVAEGHIAFLEKDLPVAVRAVNDDALLKEFEAANRIARSELSNYVAWLRTERLPQADQRFALGHERYREFLRLTEFIELTPEQILEIGRRELQAEQRRFAEAARLIDSTRHPHDVFKGIQREHPTAAGLLPDTRRNLELIRGFVVQRQIVTIPSEVRVKVEETPPPFRRTSFASMDTPGVFETNATDSYYYVTPVEPDWPEPQKEEWLTAFNYYTTDVVTIHEAYPGHYVQYLALKESRGSPLSKIASSYAFSEGWAHYTEQMLLDDVSRPRARMPPAKNNCGRRNIGSRNPTRPCCACAGWSVPSSCIPKA